MKPTSNGAFEGDNPLDFALPLAVLQICLILVLSRCLSFFLRPMRQLRVIAETIWYSTNLKTNALISMDIILLDEHRISVILLSPKVHYS
ncbi:hypothetical protein Syun_022862 [Stephania yunnanensis]|uniref:Uncharacterized protein n=1 Tax=Stephania yunnanensis TaxID=152371 RepID=A0AAP0F7V4_9MAGN